MSSLKQLFQKVTGTKADSQEQLAVSGSNRKYYRLKSENHSLIGVEGMSVEENRAFIYMARHFKSKGLPVPECLAVSKDELLYLQEDLGDLVLFDYIKKGRLTGIFTPEEKDILHRTMTLLPQVQVIGAE